MDDVLDGRSKGNQPQPEATAHPNFPQKPFLEDSSADAPDLRHHSRARALL